MVDCLVSMRHDSRVTEGCRTQLYDVLERRAATFALDAGLVTDCEDDIRRYCMQLEDVLDALQSALAACIAVRCNVAAAVVAVLSPGIRTTALDNPVKGVKLCQCSSSFLE